MRSTNKLSPLDITRLNDTGRYADGGGLYLQVTRWERDGQEWTTKAWLFRFMLNGRAREMGLGSLDTFSLKEARLRARAQRQLLADGIDPLERRKHGQTAAKLEAARTITFKDAAERYIAAHRAGWKNLKHGEQWGSTLETYAYPIVGSMPVASIDTALVMKVLQQPVKVGKDTVPFWNGKVETASRVRGRIENILDWARVQGMRNGENVASWKGHLDKLLPARSRVASVVHQAAMPWQQVPAYMGQLRDRADISARALEFTILTWARTSEAILATWDEIDFEERVWTRPAEHMKAKLEHRVPLSERAIQILKALPREEGNPHVFLGAVKGKGLSNMAMLQLLKGTHPDLTVHGFRSAARDWAGESTSFPHDICEMALAHVRENKVHGAYQRGELLTKRRKLMDAWASYCAKPASSGNVRELKRA